MKNQSFAKGVFFAVSGFLIWGILPLYWRLMDGIQPFHLLGFRIFLSFLLLATVLSVQKNFVWVTVFRDYRKGILIVIASLILCINWGVYLWAVSEGRIIEASLGYYINPLLSVVLGLIFFKEKLTRIQWTAFALACLGVLMLTLFSGTFPWISIVLAFCFAFYGFIKKKLSLSSLESLTAESLVAAPLGLALLLVYSNSGGGFSVGLGGISYIASFGTGILFALSVSGAVSSLPLYCFGNGAKMLPLSTLGFFQFISPTMKFFLGIFVFQEVFPAHHFIAFAFIWFAAVLHIISLKRQSRAQ